LTQGVDAVGGGDHFAVPSLLAVLHYCLTVMVV
jgi:hypothetical protein